MKSASLVERIIGAMRAEIEKYGLELLSRYPDDLLVHDRQNLEVFAVADAEIAWMVGHSHTHIVQLGLHPKENQGTTYLTNLANDDRFYVVKILSSGSDFTMKEVSRESFGALANTPVRYKRDGGRTGFWLIRDGQRVGSVMLEAKGNLQRPKYHGTITPVAGCTARDKAALRMWCEKSIVEEAGTLFVHYNIDEAPSIALAQAA